jgi:hypothetical protein
VTVREGVRAVVLGLKIKLRDVVVRLLLTIARWIIEALSDENDEVVFLEPRAGSDEEKVA